MKNQKEFGISSNPVDINGFNHSIKDWKYNKHKEGYVMKRLLMAIVIVIVLSALIPVTAFAATSGDYEYSDNGDGTCTITNYNGTATDLYIPSSINSLTVTTIGNSAFMGCESLTSITIPNSVTTIGNSAFMGCESLTSITIPNSVTSINFLAFADCTSLTSITIPNSVISIDNGTFSYCTSLNSIIIPNSVISIGSGAFQYCSSLTSVTIPDSVLSIGDRAFEYCTSLISVTIPDSVTSIGDYVFRECTNLLNIVVGENNTVYSSLDGVLFNKAKTEIILYPRGKTGGFSIPNSVLSINWNTFAYCMALTDVTIPESLISIGNGTFSNCPNLINIIVSENNSMYSSLDGVFFNKTKTEIIKYPNGKVGSYIIPSSVTSIIESAFNNCRNLTALTIPNSVTSIGNSTFYNCRNLASVTIPDSITSIGFNAFGNCFSLANVTIPDSMISIGNYAFAECTSLTSVTIPNSMTSIGEGVFEGCIGLTSVTIPDSVTYIGRWPFGRCTSLTSVTIPDSVTSIDDGAFQGCTSLTSMTIPGSVTSIGDYVFWECTSLTNVIISDGLTSIGNSMFWECTSLTSVTIPSSVTSIENSAFNGCISLTSVTIPDSVLSIGNGAFYKCTSLTSVTIPDSVLSIGYGAFLNCTSLTSVTIPSSVTSIGNNAFDGCHEDLVIYGVSGSYAETYANDNNIPFAFDVTAPVITIYNPLNFEVLPVGAEIVFDVTDDYTSVCLVSAVLNKGVTTEDVYSGFTPGVGVYTLTIEATDDAGNTSIQTIGFVIYDSEGGFVTGGGWINSPVGAYTLDETLFGKATFGFVSKYKKGASVPTGSTEFQFKVADLNFKSSSYDWLIVAGTKAMYKGIGTINGVGEYRFMLTATDGDKKDNPDRFRIKIWNKVTEQVIYDNQIDTGDLTTDGTLLRGGSIVVHK